MKNFFKNFSGTVGSLTALLLVSQSSAVAAPGNLGQAPLFVAAPTQPNIFFMLDDSGSMAWSMPSDGVSSTSLIDPYKYELIPDNDAEWFTWCVGANLLAYNPDIEYKPWSATQPGKTDPFPDQTDVSADLSKVWVDPHSLGTGTTFTDDLIYGSDQGTKDIRDAPVVTWTDTDNDGQYDAGECPNSSSDSRVRLAKNLSATEKKNFANWFSYYRIREHTTKAAVTSVIASSSARMGMATLHHNNSVGKVVADMKDATKKKALLDDVVKINSDGGTPLRQRLDWVGQYFDSSAPSGLNLGAASSPVLSAANGGECQQNFVMLMTDGQWNGSDPGVGHQDKTVDDKYVFRAHRDVNDETLADVAMKWYKTDLSAIANKVPVQIGDNTQNLDENDAQHLVTFGVAFGPTGTLSSDPTDRTANFTWPKPTADADETVDDLRHAAYNGRGKFLSANNPSSLISALEAVISDIEARQGSAAAVSFNSTSLTATSTLFFASFDTTSWRGDLQAFSVDPITGDLATTASWSSGALLDARTNSNMLNNRVAYTWGLDGSGNKQGTLFQWATANPQPHADILGDFKKNQDSSIDSSPFTNSIKRLSFVRGDTTNDGQGLIRKRRSRLGDIIHSSPEFVGEPLSNWPDATPFGDGSYSSYQASQKTTPRQTMVYVGANDGFLHGFRATDGEEVLSYVPSAPASANDNAGLHYLTESDYAHRYYVDGSPASADVYIDPNGSGTQSWRTILLGSLRGGGEGVYALDVTDPSQFANTEAAAGDIVLWEFTDQSGSGDPDLGYTFSDPQVAMLNNNQWAVILGNGYNNAAGSDTAKLMILFIEGGLDGQWTLGTDYIKLDTGVGSSANKNGLSTPSLIDLDGNGTIDRIYAGDLHGNLWAFDVSDSSASNWDVAHKDTSSNNVPLFAAGTTKPITMQPLVHKVDWVTNSTGITPNLMIYFGTGQYIATGDATNTDQQSFYGIWDTGATVLSSQLVEQTFLTGFPADARVLSANNVSFQNPPSNGNLGWFLNLPATGERVVVNAFELQGLIFFNTVIPTSTPCSAGGSSWLMAVDKKTGGNPGIVAFDYNNSGSLDENDRVADPNSTGSTVNIAGVTFGHGLASATTVVKNSAGKAFGYISGTKSLKPIKTPLPGGAATGGRRAWLQLFND